MKKKRPLRFVPARPEDLAQPARGPRAYVFYLAIFLVTAAIAGAIQLLPYTPYSTGQSEESTSNYELARVIEVQSQNLSDSEHQSGIPVGTQTLRMEILSGSYSGQVPGGEHMSTFNSVRPRPGTRLSSSSDGGGTAGTARVYKYSGNPGYTPSCCCFSARSGRSAAARALLSAASLIYTLACVFLIFLPLVLGDTGIWSMILLVALVSCATMLLIQGPGKKSVCAMAGSICGVVLSGLVLLAFGALMHLSGYHTEEAESLLLISQTTGLKVGELLFAGILIAALGAVMDTAMSIVAAMSELHAKLPGSPCGSFQGGMNVGKDMIGTKSNTLILAFPPALGFILLMCPIRALQQLMNMNALAIEFVQAFSGSLGLVLTVPLTAAFTARLLVAKK